MGAVPYWNKPPVFVCVMQAHALHDFRMVFSSLSHSDRVSPQQDVFAHVLLPIIDQR